MPREKGLEVGKTHAKDDWGRVRCVRVCVVDVCVLVCTKHAHRHAGTNTRISTRQRLTDVRVKGGEGFIQVEAAVSREEKFEPADPMPARVQAKVLDSSANDSVF